MRYAIGARQCGPNNLKCDPSFQIARPPTNKPDLFREGEVSRYPLHSLQKQDAGFAIVWACPHGHGELRAWFTHCIHLRGRTGHTFKVERKHHDDERWPKLRGSQNKNYKYRYTYIDKLCREEKKQLYLQLSPGRVARSQLQGPWPDLELILLCVVFETFPHNYMGFEFSSTSLMCASRWFGHVDLP